MNAEAEQNGSDAQGDAPKKGSLGGILVWVVVSMIGIGAGFAAPMFLMPSPDDDTETKVAEKQEPLLPIPDPEEEIGFIPFDKDVVVNIRDPRFSRYIKMNFTLQVAKSQIEDITKLMEEKHDLLRNWLITHMADKALEEIQGKQGTNRLRREIHDSFNRLMFTDGIERIQDVLFQDLSVQ